MRKKYYKQKPVIFSFAHLFVTRITQCLPKISPKCFSAIRSTILLSKKFIPRKAACRIAGVRAHLPYVKNHWMRKLTYINSGFQNFRQFNSQNRHETYSFTSLSTISLNKPIQSSKFLFTQADFPSRQKKTHKKKIRNILFEVHRFSRTVNCQTVRPNLTLRFISSSMRKLCFFEFDFQTLFRDEKWDVEFWIGERASAGMSRLGSRSTVAALTLWAPMPRDFELESLSAQDGYRLERAGDWSAHSRLLRPLLSRALKLFQSARVLFPRESPAIFAVLRKQHSSLRSNGLFYIRAIFRERRGILMIAKFRISGPARVF